MTEQNSGCTWVGPQPIYRQYHDDVWGRPVYDDRELFEKLCLDGQQAGLSWIAILQRQEDYQRLFAGFEPEKLVLFTEADVDRLMQDPRIIRNRQKIRSIIANARAYMKLKEQQISFSELLWSFVEHRQVVNRWQRDDQIPVSTPASEAMAKQLKKLGFSFVGPTICYAFMQAVGIVNDHLVSCPCHPACIDQRSA